MKENPLENEKMISPEEKPKNEDIDWEEVDKEAKRCLKICMEMDELDNN